MRKTEKRMGNPVEESEILAEHPMCAKWRGVRYTFTHAWRWRRVPEQFNIMTTFPAQDDKQD